MRFPRECYHLHHSIETHFPQLRPAQQWGLVLWVYGTLLAQNGCQSAVITALSVLGNRQTIRDRLRDWLYDGCDKSAPCSTQMEITTCFAPLLRWVLSLWQGDELALAVDVTNHHDRLHVLAISVLYRGSAIPVAWRILPGNTKGAWMPHLCQLIDLLAPAVPASCTVLVLVDRGLRSPTLWQQVVRYHWHPVLRLQGNTVFRPNGDRQGHPARSLLTGPGAVWVGQGHAFQQHPRSGTVIVLWQEGADEPWVLFTDLAPHEVGVAWYGLRTWIELGFRCIKSLGFNWHRTRRTDPDRVGRHWLVMAVALVWITAYGTRVEDATAQHLPPARLRHPPATTPCDRTTSLFRLGLAHLRWHLFHGRLWRCLWLAPEPWPSLPAGCTITYHAASP